MICHNALSCTDFSLMFRSFWWFFIFCNMYHMMTSWLSREFIIAKYICFLVIIDESQVDSMIVCMIFCLITNFALTWCMWVTHLSLKFSWTLKTLISDFESIWCLINSTLTFILNHLKILVKWINSCFVFENLMSCVFDHCLHSCLNIESSSLSLFHSE